MQTLPRAITAQFFAAPSAYADLRAHWRALMTSDRRVTLTAEHHLLYSALLGKDWRAAFAPITNPRKLANGAFQGWALFRALNALHSPWQEHALLAPFDGLVISAMLAQLRVYLPRPDAYRLQPVEFTTQPWPFDAYIQPAALAQ